MGLDFSSPFIFRRKEKMREPKDIKINGKTLDVILEEHEHWCNEDIEDWENMRANLSYADLSCVNLRGANLYRANLHGADLHYADLRGADLNVADLNGAILHNTDLSGTFMSDAKLCDANLSCANLNHADLGRANLSCAYMHSANLSCADLSEAILYDADLRYTNLHGADLNYADLSNTNLQDANLGCADLREASLSNANLCSANISNTKGSLIEYRKGKMLTEAIIGYKQCKNGIIVTLEIPRGAIVFSINGGRCRTNKAKVIAIDGSDRAFSQYKYMSYYINDEFTIYDFNCEYNQECAEGIHFFMTRKEAEKDK
jgi:uncharacterized protein YjbI with pentapeptide repeats